MKHLSLGAASLAMLLCATATAGLAILSEQTNFETEVDRRFFSPRPLRAAQRLPSGGSVTLKAYQLTSSGRRPLWASLGRPSLVRGSNGRVFRPSSAGFSARLLLRHPTDDSALAAAATSAVSSPVSVCQIVRMPPARLTCIAAVRLPEGFVIEVTGGSSVELTGGQGQFPATATVVFNSLGGVWSPEALDDLEHRGEIVCRLSALRPRADSQQPAVLMASTVHLRAEDAVELTPGLLRAAAAPTPACGLGSRSRIDLVAVYNFRSNRRIANLAPGAGRRYQVLGRGRVNFTLEGMELPGRSWIEIDTEGGALTEHMRFDSKWSVFFMFRMAASSLHRRANLFSVHANNNPMACSVLAWTAASSRRRRQQDAIYSRQHNLAGGYAKGLTTQPTLDPRPGAWNRVGIASDVHGRQTVYINGARAPSAAVYRFPGRQTASREQQAALRHSLSIGLVRGPGHAMLGTFRCFGVARGALNAEQFHDAFATYCQ